MIFTGLAIGSSNAERLYTSEAFSAKMVGLAAGLILTFGFALPTARAGGVASAGARLAAVAGLGVFAFAVALFASAKLANPGLWHVIAAGALVAAIVSRGPVRIVFLIGLAGLVAAQQWLTHVTIRFDDYARLDPTNKAFAWTIAAWVLAAFAVQAVVGRRAEPGGAFVR